MEMTGLGEFIDKARAINLRLMLLELDMKNGPAKGPPPILGGTRFDFRVDEPMRAFDGLGNEILDPVTSIDVLTGRAEVLELDKNGQPFIRLDADGATLARRKVSYVTPITLLPLSEKLRALRGELRGPSHPFELPGGLGEDLGAFFVVAHEEAEWLGANQGDDVDWAFRHGWAAGRKRGLGESRLGFFIGFVSALVGVSLGEAIFHCFWR